MKKILSICLLFSFLHVQAQEADTMLGTKAPDFTLKGLDDKTYSLGDFKGRYLVIHFATTWCPFCNAEAPYLEELYQSYREKGVSVLIIDVKEKKELVQNTFSRFNFSFPVLLDPDGKVSASYAPGGILPDLARDEVMLASNLILDKEGRIQFFSLLDSKSFDAKLIKAKSKLDELLKKDGL